MDNPSDDLSEAVAALTDADNALEALRQVALTVERLDRNRLAQGHGGAQPAQLDALMYLIHAAQRHISTARDAGERTERMLEHAAAAE